MHLMHTCIMLTPCVVKAIIDSRWVRKGTRPTKRTNMSGSENEGSRLDQLETKVTEITEMLQDMTNVVTSLAELCMANGRELCNQNGRIIGEPSKTKLTPSEAAPIRNR